MYGEDYCLVLRLIIIVFIVTTCVLHMSVQCEFIHLLLENSQMKRQNSVPNKDNIDSELDNVPIQLSTYQLRNLSKSLNLSDVKFLICKIAMIIISIM